MKHIKLFEYYRNGNFKSTKDAEQAFEAVTQLSAQEMEEFLFGLSAYFLEKKDEITNMNSESISGKLAEAAEMVQNRSGN